MLKGGDLDLNSVYGCTDSLKQRLKQKMLNQELVFMRQVYELHRLYRIQAAMMEDFKRKGLDDYNLHNGGVKLISESKNNPAQCLMHEQHTLSGIMQKPLDLQLTSDEFISHCVDDWEKPLRDSLKEPIESKNSSQGMIVSDVDKMKLSLSIGQDDSKANKTCASVSTVIDLEDPYIRFSNHDPYFAPPITSSRDEHILESFSQIGMRDVFYGTPASSSLLYIGPSCQKQTPSDSGFIGHHGELIYADLLSKNKKSGTCKANNLDLNMVQHEDSLYFSSSYSMVHNPSGTSFSGVSDKVYAKCTIPTSSSPTSWKNAVVNRHTESRQFDLNLDLAQSYRENDTEEWNKDEKCRVDDGGKISFLDLDSDSGENLCRSRSNPKIESVDSSSKLSNGLSCNIDLVDAVEAEHPICNNKLSSSSESACVIDNHSSSLKTMQSVAKCGDFYLSSSDESQNANRHPLADNSEEQESNTQCINRKEPELDEMVQTAAESLVQISLEARATSQEGDQSQCSMESYEAMVLREKESALDDYCVSSNAFVVEESENKGSSRYNRLKRGTRMKDFQKDVLPSLSILSRHEIRQDINIMEGVIRSREYKKMRAKFGDGGDWFRPARSKRSKVSYSRRFYP